jgi:hypothetical protein
VVLRIAAWFIAEYADLFFMYTRIYLKNTMSSANAFYNEEYPYTPTES